MRRTASLMIGDAIFRLGRIRIVLCSPPAPVLHPTRIPPPAFAYTPYITLSLATLYYCQLYTARCSVPFSAQNTRLCQQQRFPLCKTADETAEGLCYDPFVLLCTHDIIIITTITPISASSTIISSWPATTTEECLTINPLRRRTRTTPTATMGAVAGDQESTHRMLTANIKHSGVLKRSCRSRQRQPTTFDSSRPPKASSLTTTRSFARSTS